MKSLTHKKVLQRLEKKWPGFKNEVKAELANLRLAEQIVTCRRQAHLSQKQLALKIGTTQSNVARMENPNYSDYKVSTLSRIATATRGRFVIKAA